MKFFHLADLHFGKSLHGFSLIDQGDQPDWVCKFLELVDETKPDAVCIAGDVYDRSVPSREAVELLDKLLTELSERGIAVLLIAGNHDSGPRLNFASALLKKQNVYIAGNVEKEIRHVELQDEYGPVTFWLLPYLFPAAVEEALGQEDGELRSYDAAARAILHAQNVDFSKRNILVAHQFVLSGKNAPQTGGSETMVGGVGQIDCSAFDGFDYVALGHIHRPQIIGRETVRYAGSPLCYHFSELGWKKGPLLVEIGEKGSALRTQLFELPALHPMREIRGLFSEIMESEKESAARGEYIRCVLTDSHLPPDAVKNLSDLFLLHNSYPMDVARENPRAGSGAQEQHTSAQREKTIEELFTEFYRTRMNGEFPDGAEQELIRFASDQVVNAPGDATQDDLTALADKLVCFACKQEEDK